MSRTARIKRDLSRFAWAAIAVPALLVFFAANAFGSVSASSPRNVIGVFCGETATCTTTTETSTQTLTDTATDTTTQTETTTPVTFETTTAPVTFCGQLGAVPQALLAFTTFAFTTVTFTDTQTVTATVTETQTETSSETVTAPLVTATETDIQFTCPTETITDTATVTTTTTQTDTSTETSVTTPTVTTIKSVTSTVVCPSGDLKVGAAIEGQPTVTLTETQTETATQSTAETKTITQTAPAVTTTATQSVIVCTTPVTTTTTTSTTQSSTTTSSPTTSSTSRGVVGDVGITKSASPTHLPAGGGTVNYTYLVSDKGDVPLKSITLSDDKCQEVGFVGGDTNGNHALDVFEQWTYTCSAGITATTTNTAVVSATWDDPSCETCQGFQKGGARPGPVPQGARTVSASAKATVVVDAATTASATSSQGSTASTTSTRRSNSGTVAGATVPPTPNVTLPPTDTFEPGTSPQAYAGVLIFMGLLLLAAATVIQVLRTQRR